MLGVREHEMAEGYDVLDRDTRLGHRGRVDGGHDQRGPARGEHRSHGCLGIDETRDAGELGQVRDVGGRGPGERVEVMVGERRGQAFELMRIHARAIRIPAPAPP